MGMGAEGVMLAEVCVPRPAPPTHTLFDRVQMDAHLP